MSSITQLFGYICVYIPIFISAYIKKDVDELEKILWRELGTKEDYEAEFGRKPLGEFVREMVGLDMNAAKEAGMTPEEVAKKLGLEL